MRFRTLKADEIDCRVKQITRNGISILLYKDARVDQNILDETVGAMNWQRHHSRDNANCTVSIWDDDKKQWVEKEDTGKESNTEAEKGLASDSFKRACFNWGIGRELYSAPFIWIGADKVNIEIGKNGKEQCYDKFVVKSILYDSNRNITSLTIINAKTNIVVYQMGQKQAEPQKPTEPQKTEPQKTTEQQKPTEPQESEEEQFEKIAMMKIPEIKVKALISTCAKEGVKEETILKLYKVKSLTDLTELQFRNINEFWEEIKKV